MYPLKSAGATRVTGAASFLPMGMAAGPFRDREYCILRHDW